MFNNFLATDPGVPLCARANRNGNTGVSIEGEDLTQTIAFQTPGGPRVPLHSVVVRSSSKLIFSFLCLHLLIFQILNPLPTSSHCKGGVYAPSVVRGCQVSKKLTTKKTTTNIFQPRTHRMIQHQRRRSRITNARRTRRRRSNRRRP